MIIKQSKTTQLINKLKKDSILFVKKRRRRIIKKQKTNKLNLYPLTIITRSKRTTRLNTSLVLHTTDQEDTLDVSGSSDTKSDNSSNSSSYQP